MKETIGPRTIEIEIPGRTNLRISHLFLDFNGTIAKDGALIPGVKPRLMKLARKLQIIVLTADTHGTARQTLGKLQITVRVVGSGREKRRILRAFKTRSRAQAIVAIGNGRNDVAMMKSADLGIAVIGPEGLSCDLLRHASVLAPNILDALDLMLKPKRLIGTLRP